jgi:c-di-GMP-binding flagellar brake protein YcgR
MVEKVYIARNNMATFVCPSCENTTTVDVTKYIKMDKKVRVNIRCRCGHSFVSELEKRKKYRKRVNLPGTYTYSGPGHRTDKGIMTVRDISSTGLKLRLNVKRNFEIGEKMVVEFNLDDRRRTPISKKVIVKNIVQNYIGVAFSPNEPDTPALGFYLMN